MSSTSRENAPLPVRQRIAFNGRVQGVGFRATCARIAERFAIEGFVQNLSDGSVQLVAEGGREDVDLFVASVGTAMRPYIRSQERTETIATGEFGRFFIKRGGY